jgi:hypothetical protein
MSNIGRNDPCPCGSGKKYKRCCLGKGIPPAVVELDPLASFREEVESALKSGDFPDLETAEEELQGVAGRHNMAGISEFHNLSPTDMHALLNQPFSSPDIVQWPNLTHAPTAPVATLAKLLLDGIGDGIGKTAKGNLPQKLVMAAAQEYATTENVDFPGQYERLRREEQFESLHVVRLVCELAGIIETEGKRFVPTMKCRALLAEGGIAAIYGELLRTYLVDFNWAYRDMYEDCPGIQHTAMFTLYLLSQYGSEFRDWEFYADAFLAAFPMVEQEAGGDHLQTARDTVLWAYRARALERFARFFGLVEIDKTDYMNAVIRATPLLQRVVRFNPDREDNTRGSARTVADPKVTALTPKHRREWQGKRVSVGYIEEEGRYATMELWLSMPDDIIVHHGEAGNDPGEVTDALREVITTHGATCLTVHDQKWGAALQAAFPNLEVRIGPTPEVNEAADGLLESLAEHADGVVPYLTADIDSSTMASLFESTANLYVSAPWKRLEDWQIICVDIPEMNIEGACISVIGAVSGDCGYIVFSSIAGYFAMLEWSDDIVHGGAMDLGEDFLSVSYERGGDLPRAMREEIRQNDWRVANSRAYPSFTRHAADGSPRELTQRDAMILGACANALSAMIDQDQHRFNPGEPALFSHSITDPHSGQVHIYSPPPQLAASAPVQPGPLPEDEILVTDSLALDFELYDRLRGFIGDRWPGVLAREVARNQSMGEATDIGYITAYCERFEDNLTPAEWFLREGKTDQQDREWIGAQLESWFSIWYITDTHDAPRVTLHDLLTNCEMTVLDHGLAAEGRPNLCLMARMVKIDDAAIIVSTSEVLTSMEIGRQLQRKMLKRLRRKTVNPKHLRNPKTARYLIRQWYTTVDQ